MNARDFTSRATLLAAALLPACSTINIPADADLDAGAHADAAPGDGGSRDGARADATSGDATHDVPHIGTDVTTGDVANATDVPPLDVPTVVDVTPADTGPAPDAAAQCDATCPQFAHCISGVCQCDPYFQSQGGACVAVVPSDPAGRSESEVCQMLSTRWPGGGMFVPGTGGMCDAGGLDRGAIDDTLAAINTYRWLVGLSPVTDSDPCDARDQQCAMMESMHGFPNGTFNPHSPTSDWTCYTPEGAGAAGSSNIAWGVGDAAGSIGLYIADWGNESTMGHRRWVLSTNLGAVGVGYYSGASCLGVFSCGGDSPPNSVSPPWHSYPPPGPAPTWTLSGIWTFHSQAYSFGSSVAVTITRASDNSVLPVTVTPLGGGYGDPTISWTAMGWMPASGETYHVSISGLSGPGDTVAYDVHAIDCP